MSREPHLGCPCPLCVSSISCVASASISLDSICQLQNQLDDRRRSEPLRQRVLGSIITALQAFKEGGFARPDLGHVKVLERAAWSFQNDAFFHAIAQVAFNEIMQDIQLGEIK